MVYVLHFSQNFLKYFPCNWYFLDFVVFNGVIIKCITFWYNCNNLFCLIHFCNSKLPRCVKLVTFDWWISDRNRKYVCSVPTPRLCDSLCCYSQPLFLHQCFLLLPSKPFIFYSIQFWNWKKKWYRYVLLFAQYEFWKKSVSF